MTNKISKKLTDRSVAALNAGNRPYLVYDTEVGKLAARVLPSGSKAYVIYVRLPGCKSPTVRKIASDASTQIWKPQQARERAQVLLNKIAIGENPFEDLKTGVTFEQAFRNFLTDKLQKKGVEHLGIDERRMWPELERQQFNTFRKFVAKHKAILLTDVTEQKVSNFIGNWHKRSEHGARKSHSALRQLFKHYKIHPNPANSYPSISPPVEEVKFMEEEAHANMIIFTEQLFEEDPVKASALKFLAGTGVRPSEALTLERQDTGANNYVDRRRGEIVLRRHKTRRRVQVRRVPLSKRILAMLNEMDTTMPAAEQYRFLFPDLDRRRGAEKPLSLRQTNDAFKKGWHRVCETLKLPEYKKKEITQRHFRHTYGTRVIAEETMTIEMLKSYFGHTSYATTQKYIGTAEQMNNKTSVAVDKISWI